MFKAFFLCLLIAIAGCSTTGNSDELLLKLEGQWTQAGLADHSINELKHSPEKIYTATTQGLFSRSLLAGSSESWNKRGLEDKEIVDFIIFSDQKILAGIQLADIESHETSLFRTQDGGKSWQPFQNNFGGEDHYNWFTAISQDPQNSSILYAKSGLFNVAKSTDKGNNWQLVKGDWQPHLGISLFLKIDINNPDIIWAGGSTVTFAPHLVKTTDAGNSWQGLKVVQNVETNVHDIAIHPSDSNMLLIGMAGAIQPANLIRKSTDGGKSWQTVWEGIGTLTLTNSTRNPETVYASGRNTNGTLFFAASRDFGATWETVEMQGSPADMQVNDMVSVMVEGQEMLYFGTNKGVYSYRFEE